MPGPAFTTEVEELFHSLVEMPAAERAAAAERAGPEVARRALVLAAAYDEAAHCNEGFRGRSPAVRHYGPYRTVRLLGTGGMGAVYLAERDDGELEQTVAIKVIGQHLAGEAFERRFHAERQILANLAHPHIARLMDGNTTEDGEPYLVMEYVDGAALDRYLEENRVPVPQRLELFLKVCSAVSFAHRNLVIHRDLKPSNIVVTAGGEPKLLDFGAARLLNREDAAVTTAMATPRYASPEQLRARPATTVSDVYSLGVILYEMLAGESPFPGGDALEVAVRRASGELAPVPLGMGGDLSTIVGKALEADPERRYGSVQELADDIRRYLDRRPIAARPASFVYRASRFVNRNRWSVAAGAALALAIAAGVVSTVWQAQRAQRRFAEVRSLARFLVFDIHDDLERMPGTTALQKKTVERSLAYLDGLSKEAGGDAALRLEIAQAYRRLGDVLGNPFLPSLGDRKAAAGAYAKGLEALASLERTREVRLTAATLQVQQGATLTFGAVDGKPLELVRGAVAALRELERERPEDVELWIALAQGLTVLGTRSAAGGGTVEAVARPEVAAYLEESLAVLTRALAMAPGDARVVSALAQRESALGLMMGSSEPAKSIAHYRKAVEWLDGLPEGAKGSLQTGRMRANILANVGWAEGQSGRYEQAIRDLTETVSILKAWSEMDEQDTTAMYQLSGAYRARGIVYGYRHDAAAAVADFSTAAALHQRLSRRDPSNVVYRYLRAELLARSGNLLVALGRRAEAKAAAGEGLAALVALASAPKATLGHVFGACRWLTETEVVDLRDPAAAARFCRAAVERTNGEDPDAFEGLATALDQCGDRKGAVEAAERALSLVPPATPGEPVSQQRRDMEAALRNYQRKLAGGGPACASVRCE